MFNKGLDVFFSNYTIDEKVSVYTFHSVSCLVWSGVFKSPLPLPQYKVTVLKITAYLGEGQNQKC